eukprot:scaffold13450_cov78-Skeletonema_dohrnii-CCMP3373.AAC.1
MEIAVLRSIKLWFSLFDASGNGSKLWRHFPAVFQQRCPPTPTTGDWTHGRREKPNYSVSLSLSLSSPLSPVVGVMPTTPADSDTRTATVRDSMMLPSRGVTGGLLGWSGYEVMMVQSMVAISTESFCENEGLVPYL